MYEAITYFSRNLDDSFAQFTVDRAWRLGVNEPEAGFNLQNPTPAFMTWEVLASFIDVVPQEQDYIIDKTGVKWIVNIISTKLKGGMYQLECTRGVPVPAPPTGPAYLPEAPPID
jgi:hypothetical protein